MTTDELTREFIEFRPRLLGIAYRLLGSAWDAEDVVADAMVRWMRVDRTEPSALGPLDTVERREAVSLASLRMMEALTPPERAVLVLHEVFDMSHAEIASILDITEAGARQHLRRARAHLRSDSAPSEPAVHDAALAKFLAALENGDLDKVQRLLAADVISYSDGGGKARAAHRPIVGAREVAAFLTRLRRQRNVRDARTLHVNGTTAATLWFGRQFTLLALDVGDAGIREIHWIMNPDKLSYLGRQLADAYQALDTIEQRERLELT